MARIFFTNATLIPGDGPARANATVVVKGERIEQVLAHGGTPAPDDRMVDLGGRALMPGMVTCHHHGGYHHIGAKPLPVGFEAPPAYLALAAGRNLDLLLARGFTGAVGAGVGYAIDAATKQAVEDGLIRGPRLMASGRALSTTGFSLDYQQPWYWQAPLVDVRVCDGPDGFRKAVRDEIKEGAEIIKLYSTGGHLSVTPGQQTEMDRDELAAAINAAHAHGAKVRTHASNAKAVLEAVELGIDVIDHADLVDASGLDAMLKAGVFFVPSMRLPIEAEKKGWSFGPIEELRAEIDHMRKMLPRANAAGLKIVLGDDYGVVILEHGRQNEELSFYVRELGIPPLDVIRWATKNGADLMGRGHELGTIEAGKIADILIVDGNPLDDMSLLDDTKNLLAIVKGGQFMKDDLASIPAANRARKVV